MRYFICLGILAALILVDGQNGFVSIDCGFSGDNAYLDHNTDLKYDPDAKYIDSGSNHELDDEYTINQPVQAQNLRSFSNGVRNCYTISNVIQGHKYLIRASFLYGNYDGKNQSFTFDLYLGVNLWQTINITDAHHLYNEEIITLASYNYFSICLVKTSGGNPFISSLEIRLIDNEFVYKDVNQTVSLQLLGRKNMGSHETVRYPKDRYDRIWWEEYNSSCSLCRAIRPSKDVKELKTASSVRVDPDDPYDVPSVVMQTADTPPDNLTLMVSLSDGDNRVILPTYIYLHFAELEVLKGNKNRIFQVKLPNGQSMNNITPEYLVASHTRLILQASTDTNNYYLNLTKVLGSMLPPLLNAFEAYSFMNTTNVATNQGDVYAMMSLKKLYNTTSWSSSWQGDPCVPMHFAWDKINCIYSTSALPRVTSLNLSYSGLKGTIPDAIANLTAIKHLDLSNNYLERSISPFLANLNSLQTLDLSSNQLDGFIPTALCNRQAKGLQLRLDDNPCNSKGTCVCRKQNDHSYHVLIISMGITAVVVLVLILLAMFFLRRKRGGNILTSKLQPKWRHIRGSSFHTENPHFTYQDLRTITNNFEKVLGKGGFGTVYYGQLPDGTEVAVKMQRRLLAIGEGITEELVTENLSSDSHGMKEFQVEAKLLSRVHHRNLVSLVGYCNDGFSLGLVFEYAAQGSLRDHLSVHSGKISTWRDRLRIAIDSAQGLEYLHKGCKPPIIHRDVKTSNILLSDHLEAKIADFGLSKTFLSDGHTHVSTEAIVGTPGYVDPEYHKTYRLNEKSDVYSFGVVLLELVTGLPAVIRLPEISHILEWVQQGLSKGNLAHVVDPRLQQQFEIYSVRKIIDLAMNCTALDPNERPNMTEVVMQLKECLQLEIAREGSTSTSIEVLDVNLSGSTEVSSSISTMESSSFNTR
ncbi:putative leucine-rich repeat receptor-like protein kinase [Canna indica]|uniref:non-specific serine/threonine protein kinase n=1 Tax=Canna indica TaxID=4628 RepID=A0AAQ3KMS6_9LILI|nr:putative leucine-rich repeat receptor-like protein kinase [Canna indica]